MQRRRFLITLCPLFFAFALIAAAQDDQPSLGDVARQSRQQKQQNEQSPAVQTNKDVRNGEQSSGAQKNASSVGNQNKNQAAVSPTAKTAKPKHVFTNDEIPSKGGPTGYAPPVPQSANQEPAPADGQQSADSKGSAEEWTSQIASQKSSIANLQGQIDSLNSSVQYTGANCVANCEQWNEAQKKKQDEVETMKVQLEEAQKHLQEMQEQARQQGYGSSVYEP
jgi:hypothetical protein